MVSRVIGSVRNNVAVFLALAITAGVLFPEFASLLSPYVFPSLFVLMTATLVIVTERPIESLTNPEPAVWGIMLWQMAFIPLLTILFGWATNLAPDLHLMLLVTATSGSVSAAPALAHVFRINSRLPVNGMVLSTFLMPVALLMFGAFLEGDGLELSLSEYLWRVGVFLILPLSFAILINRLIGVLSATEHTHVKSGLHAAAFVAMVIFGIGIMDGVADMIASQPDRVLTFLVLVIGFELATIVGTAILFWSLGRDLLFAATILSVHRNVALTYAVIGAAAGSDFGIYIAVCQVPLFLSPLVIKLACSLAMLRKSPVTEGQAT